MKLVTVVIKPFKLEDVREALSSIGIQGLTVTEVKGFGRQKGPAELYRGAEYSVNFLPKVKIDVAIADDQLDEVIDVMYSVGRSIPFELRETALGGVAGSPTGCRLSKQIFG